MRPSLREERLLAEKIFWALIKDPLQQADLEADKNGLIVALTSYIINKPPDGSESESESDSSIVYRAICFANFGTLKWHIQRGLRDIGYRKGGVGDLALKMDFDTAGNMINLRFDGNDFRQAFSWARKFAQGLQKSLEDRFHQQPLWNSLRQLTNNAALWASDDVPASILKTIAKKTKLQTEELETLWAQIKEKVVARIGEQLPGEFSESDFRESLLLPALAECAGSPLRKLLVTAAITFSETAQLHRDNKELRKELGEHKAQLGSSAVPDQLQLSLNYRDRCNELRGRQKEVLSMAVAKIKELFDAANNHEIRRSARISSSPSAGSHHKSRKRRAHDDLSEESSLSPKELRHRDSSDFSDQSASDKGLLMVSCHLLAGID